MAGFVQIIEFRSTRIEEIRALNEEWRRTHPQMGPSRITVTADRDRPDTYLSVVEFGSYEEAMRNSEDPQTGEWAARMAELCDGEPSFRNLDVILSEVRMDIAGQRSAAGALTDA